MDKCILQFCTNNKPQKRDGLVDCFLVGIIRCYKDWMGKKVSKITEQYCFKRCCISRSLSVIMKRKSTANPHKLADIDIVETHRHILSGYIDSGYNCK